MPPKKGKKKGKKKSAKPKTPTVIDGMSTEEMSKEQLEEHIGRLREELDREREERNYFQLERDKVNTFWEITKRQLDETRAELRNKDREMEDAEERHQIEIKVYKQKVKHLLYEHQNNITELKAESSIALKRAQEEHRLQESELRKDKRSLKVANKEQELAHEDADKDLRMKNDEYVTKLREDFEREAREIEAKYEKKMKVLRDELELRRKTEIHEIEERKNGQINALMRNHEKVGIRVLFICRFLENCGASVAAMIISGDDLKLRHNYYLCIFGVDISGRYNLDAAHIVTIRRIFIRIQSSLCKRMYV